MDEQEKRTKKSSFCPTGNPKLTKTEAKILEMFSEQYLTIKQIALIRKCTQRAVQKIIKKLKEKGMVRQTQPIYLKSEPFSKIRLHGQEFNIKLLWQDNYYQKRLKKSNIFFVDGNTIKLFRNSIEIYSGQSFYAEDERVATRKSADYWQRFFSRLEHNLKVIIVRPFSANINLVNQHYARTNSEITQSALDKKERIRVYAEEDGKLCFITDDSFGFKEDETLHPKTAQPDRRKIDKQVNDWRLHDPPTNSQLAEHLINVAVNQQSITKNQEVFAENMKTHIAAIQELALGVRKMTETINKLAEQKKPSKIIFRSW